MTWNTKIYWCKPTPRHKVWHIDNATVPYWVTLCGQEYKQDAVRTGEPTEAENVCPKCKKVLAKYILWYGVPDVVAW